MEDNRKPVYGEYYYTVDTAGSNAASAKDAVVRYKWLDLDDDQKLFDRHLVFFSYNSALDAAERLGLHKKPEDS